MWLLGCCDWFQLCYYVVSKTFWVVSVVSLCGFKGVLSGFKCVAMWLQARQLKMCKTSGNTFEPDDSRNRSLKQTNWIHHNESGMPPSIVHGLLFSTKRNEYKRCTKARCFRAKNMSDINSSVWKHPNSESSPAVLESKKNATWERR